MKSILIASIVFFLFHSCDQKTSKSDFSDVYELSEMSLLMEEMYDSLEVIRPNVISGQKLGTFPAKFEEIHTAEFTPSFERTPEFERFANLLLDNEKVLYSSSPDTARIDAYNQVVRTCIACHRSSSGCIGPISRISKLLILKNLN